MKDDTNLTGRWVGNYDQHGRPHPITLDLVQEGDRLTGSMRDAETDRETSVFESCAEAGLPPGADERIVASLHDAFPDVPGASIRHVTHLPPESTVEGRVEESTVSFLKVYQGTHFGGFMVGDRIVGHRIEGHAVRYRGKLSPDGVEIEGKWSIDPIAGEHRIEGWFHLRR